MRQLSEYKMQWITNILKNKIKDDESYKGRNDDLIEKRRAMMAQYGITSPPDDSFLTSLRRTSEMYSEFIQMKRDFIEYLAQNNKLWFKDIAKFTRQGEPRRGIALETILALSIPDHKLKYWLNEPDLHILPGWSEQLYLALDYLTLFTDDLGIEFSPDTTDFIGDWILSLSTSSPKRKVSWTIENDDNMPKNICMAALWILTITDHPNKTEGEV